MLYFGIVITSYSIHYTKLYDLEEILISSDVGVDTTLKIIDRLQERVVRDKFITTKELNGLLREEISNLLAENEKGETLTFDLPESSNPHVIMVVGVNGVGKTTTIGKLANKYKQAGKSGMLGAADTFRAAAIEQP